MRCAAIARGGSRCKLDATHGEYCWSHSPETESQRRTRARRGGKSGGNGRPGTSEIVGLKKDIREVISGVLSGEVGKGEGAVCFQGYNSLLKAVEIERKILETVELEERIRQLEEASGEQRGGHRWGA
jgi:hypothetical protein